MSNDEKYVQIRLTESEIAALKERAILNMRPMAAEGAMIVKLVLAGKGEAVTVPGVNELNFLGPASDGGAGGQDGDDCGETAAAQNGEGV